jgi:MFS family permease
MNNSEPGQESTTQNWYAVLVTGLLTLCFTLSFMDRQILPMLLEPVKHDFSMSDTQIGMLQGLAFSTFYACAGIPLGWMVDRYHRVGIVAVCVAAWGVATAACGLCASFGQLLVARTGTAIGEAGCSPASWSILSDLLSGRALLRATAVYSCGPYLGGGLALILGSVALRHFTGMGGLNLPLVGHIEAWQAVFVVMGLPGLFLGALILTLREPRRRESGIRETDTSTRATLEVLFGSSQLMFFFTGSVFVSSGLYIVLTWFPSLMIREGFGTAATVGRPLGVLFLTVGLASAFLSQSLVRNLDNRDLLRPLFRRLAIVLVIQVPLVLAFALVDTSTAGYLLYAGEVAIFAAFTSLMGAPIQLIMPNRMRGRATGLYLLSNNVLGATLGPAAVGALSDRMKGSQHGLEIAFVTMICVSSVCATIFIYLASTRRTTASQTDSSYADPALKNS